MDATTALLGSLGPGLAILVEWQHPLTPETALQHARRIVRAKGLVAAGQQNDRYRSALEELLASVALGAASVANFILTLAAMLTAAIAVVYELANSTWWILVIAILFLVLAGVVLHLIGTEDFADIASKYLARNWLLTRREQLSYCVYGINWTLLILIWLIYWGTSGQYIVIPNLTLPEHS
jgi:CBS domain containing-hemolysin-like protein